MAGFFNPFRSAPSCDRRPRRSPRYAIESLEARLSPSGFGLTAVEVSTVSTDLSTTSTTDATEISTSDSMDTSTSLTDSSTLITVSDSGTIDGGDVPDGPGEPPYTPPGSDGGPSGPA